MGVRLRRLGWLVLLVAVAACDRRGLGEPQVVAPGVRHYHLTDASLIDGPGPIAIDLLRLDPRRVDLVSALARGEVMGTEAVLDTARRYGAIAAVNAGFFLPNGDPAGLLKVGGELVSESAQARGAVAILERGSPPRPTLVFDRVTVDLAVRFDTAAGPARLTLGGVDTTRRRGELMLFTPRYHADTDTAGHGTEWTRRGSALVVASIRRGAGRSPIPRDGAVLSFGGTDPPPPLDALDVGRTVVIESHFHTRLGTAPADWAAARDIVAGAGLLVRGGRPIEDWADERLRNGFSAERHPRTMIGVDGRGEIWLAAIDGRQPDRSVGMTFAELQRLAVRLRLVDALNLDGGGSTTMVVGDEVVNRPSDTDGPRAVSDALLVLPRGGSLKAHD
jgi:hypothetical protein